MTDKDTGGSFAIGLVIGAIAGVLVYFLHLLCESAARFL